MSCDFANSLLHGYFDGELNPLRAVEFERHLSHCTECATELVDLDLLRTKLQLARLYAHAPASLRPKIRANFSSLARTPGVSKPVLWHWLAGVAALAVVAIIGSRVSLERNSEDYRSELAGELVEAHMRSLQADHTPGIISPDERAVRKWFDSQHRFALPVRDFAGSGFSLQGGRLDIVEGRATAALVYAHKGRVIDVFIWPTRERDTAPREGSRQGFQWVDWRKGKLEFCAVSDVNPMDLKHLYELMNSSASESY